MREAYVLQYGEIFTITAVVCVVGALLGLLIAARNEHAEEPASRGSAALESAAHQLRLVDRSDSSAVRPRQASRMTRLDARGSTGLVLSQSCSAVMLVVLCSCSPCATRR